MFSKLATWLPASDKASRRITSERSTMFSRAAVEPDAHDEQSRSISENVERAVRPQNHDVIDQKALEAVFGTDRQAGHDILKRFVSQAGQILGQIAAGYAQHDASQIAFHAHKLKSSARTVGANSMADLSYDLEAAGRKEDWNAIDRLAPQMPSCMQRIEKYVNENGEG